MDNATTDTRTDAKSTVREYLEHMLNVDSAKFDHLFTAVLLLFLGTQLLLSLRFKSDARIVPLIIGIPTFVLLVILFGLQVSPRFASHFDSFSSSNLFEMGDQVQDLNDDVNSGKTDDDDTASSLGNRKKLLSISAWMLLFTGLVLVIGFIPAIPLFLIAFYRLQASQSWSRTLFFTLAIWVFILIVFKIVLGSPLYPGLLEITLPF